MRQTREQHDAKNAGFLGVNCQNVDSSMSEMYGIPTGVYVLSVEPGSAAEKAGLQKGDIITEFDGVSIGNKEELKNAILYYEPSETIDVTIQRSVDGEYEKQVVKVTLGKNTSTETEQQQQEEEQSSERRDIMDPFDEYGTSPFDFFFGQ